MLDSEDRAILDFERSWWLQPGAKDQAIEHSLGLSAADYYSRLLRVIDRVGASEYDPLTVKRVFSMIDSPPAGDVAIS